MNTNPFTEIPNDTMKLILYELSVKEITLLCSTDKNIQLICNDEQFWREYVNLRHNNVINPWKELAKLSENRKVIDINYNGHITKLLIYDNMSLKEVLDQVKLMAPNKYTYQLRLTHPFKNSDHIVIMYKNNYIGYYNGSSYTDYTKADKPIKNTLLYNNLHQIDIY